MTRNMIVMISRKWCKIENWLTDTVVNWNWWGGGSVCRVSWYGTDALLQCL